MVLRHGNDWLMFLGGTIRVHFQLLVNTFREKGLGPLWRGSATQQSTVVELTYFGRWACLGSRQIGHAPIRGSFPNVSCTGPSATAVSVSVTVKVITIPVI